MKIKNILLLTFVLVSIEAASQSNIWDLNFRVTSGYIDKNPVFATKLVSNVSSSPFEFLAFERWNNINNCNICVLKMSDTAPNDTIVYITNNSLINKNPSIAYNFGGLTKAMICWETYINGRWNIYGKTYNQGIWSSEYPIDTSAGDKHNCEVIFIDSVASSLIFGLVYEKSSDIIFKRFNALSKITIYENNLTSTDTAICINPGLTKESYFTCYVYYERQKTNGQFAIYYRKATSISPYNWTVPDTLAYNGNNRNVKTISYLPTMPSFSFESDRAGRWGIYQTYWDSYNSKFTQSLIAQNSTSEYRNLVSFRYPMTGDFASPQLASYVNQANDSTRIFSGYGLPFSTTNTITVGDTLKKPVLTMNNGIPTIPYGLFRVWLVYNKDSAGYSMLYANGKKMAIPGSVRKKGTEIPNEFKLFQNFPNPFNPTTKIRFDIPAPLSFPNASPLERGFRGVFIGNPDVMLKIYDINGREIQTLVNEKLNPGTYEVTFDGSNYSSGIYFYRLTTDDFSDTKKLILLK